MPVLTRLTRKRLPGKRAKPRYTPSGTPIIRLRMVADPETRMESKATFKTVGSPCTSSQNAWTIPSIIKFMFSLLPYTLLIATQ